MSLNRNHGIRYILAALLLFVGLVVNIQSTSADDEMSDRSIILSNSSAGSLSNYLVSFALNNTSTPLAVIQIQFCANSPITTEPCDFPAGIDTSLAVLNSQIGNTGFILNNSTNGTLLLTRSASIPDSITNYYQFENIVNPNTNGEYFARIRTFSTTDTTAPDIEYGGVALAVAPNLLINEIVPPYITFCLATLIPELNCSITEGDSIDLGNLQTYSSNSGSYQFLVATNSITGYSVSVYGSTLTSGNNVIPALATPSSPLYGVSQFGINLVANTQPKIGEDPVGDVTSVPTADYSLANQFTFNDGDVVAYDTQNSLYARFTNSVMVNINKSQAPGVYSTTLTYIAVANF